MGPIKVENIIVASHLGKEIELIKLATELPNARYSSSGNPSVIIEIDTNDAGWITHRMIIKDTDPDSPSLDEFVIGEL